MCLKLPLVCLYNYLNYFCQVSVSVYFIEFAKLRALRAYVPTCLRARVPHVPLKNNVPTCLVNKIKTKNSIFRFFEKILRFA